MFRPYQQKAIDSVFDYIGKKGKHPLVALPTGSGKTFVIGGIIDRAIKEGYENILILSHVKEILKQDKECVERITNRDVAMFSAGFEVKQINKLTVAGIQSAYRSPEAFSHFDMVLIDECHLISQRGESMYQQFLSGIGDVPRIGLTATPFRLGEGYIYGPGKMFDGICCDMTSRDAFNHLIGGGYLSNLTTKATGTRLVTEGVKVTAGDFNEKALAEANNRMEITEACIDEIIARASDRKKWLIFAIDIKHAEAITHCLERKGISAAVLHSKMERDRDQIIRRFKDGEFRCLVNINILTTGFDVPDIDVVALLRPTQSPVLHVQTIGRGMRIAPDKRDCLIMDFAGNICRLGPINDVKVVTKRKGKGGGQMMAKECPQCNELVHLRVEICPVCSHKFVFRQKLKPTAGTMSPIASGRTQHWIDVVDVKYAKHNKYGGPPSLRVTYLAPSGEAIREWVCIEHNGFAGMKAVRWLASRSVQVSTVDDALASKHVMRRPRKILVDVSGKYPVVKEAIFHREQNVAYN